MTEFVKITSGNHWFDKHPEKIAGVEIKGTSFRFPWIIKGKKEDVLRVTGMVDPDNDKSKKIKIAKARAKAILMQLQLDKK
jgi:hypothetical protein